MFERVISKDSCDYFHKMNYLLNASPVFYLATFAFHSYYLLFMTSTLHLTDLTQDSKDVCFHISKAFDKVWHEGLLVTS